MILDPVHSPKKLIDRQLLPELRFADDVIVIAHDISGDLREIINEINTQGKCGLIMKTCTMTNGQHGRITICENAIQYVEQTRYHD